MNEKIPPMLLWILTLLLTIGCQNKHTPSSGGKQILHINEAQEPPTIDPRKTQDHVAHILELMFLEGLMREEPNGDITPALAEKVVISEDYQKYDFYLKKTTWSNGCKLTAGDFENTWKTMLKPDFPAPAATLLYCIKNGEGAKKGEVSIDTVGVRAVSPYHLEVQLEYPYSAFCQLLVGTAFFPYPEKIAEENDKLLSTGLVQPLIGNGPFILSKWKFSDEIRFEKNETYWDAPTVKLDEIHLSLVNDPTAALHMYEDGKLDWIGTPLSSIPEEALVELRKQGRISSIPIAGLYSYVFNTRRFPFNNAKIRKAFAYAIDREAIVQHIAQEGHIPAYSYLPPTMRANGQPLMSSHAVVLAKQYFAEGLQELGITVSDFPTIPIHYNNTYPLHYRIAQVVQQAWRQIFNINVELLNREWKVFLDDLGKNNFFVARLGGVANTPDPYHLLETFIHENGEVNYSGWMDEKYKEILDTALRVSNPMERERLFNEAETLLMDAMPIIPIYFYTFSFMKKETVKGIYVSNLGTMDFKWASLNLSQ